MSVELFKVKNYPKTGGILQIFESDDLTESLGKPLKRSWKNSSKVTESKELKRAGTLLSKTPLTKMYKPRASLISCNLR